MPYFQLTAQSLAIATLVTLSWIAPPGAVAQTATEDDAYVDLLNRAPTYLTIDDNIAPIVTNPILPLSLKLTADQVQLLIKKYRPDIELLDADVDDQIIVTAPNELIPMRDMPREIWGGIAAPFWAIAHPTQAWRIFLPIPPR